MLLVGFNTARSSEQATEAVSLNWFRMTLRLILLWCVIQHHTHGCTDRRGDGAETWATTKIQEKRIEVTEMRMIRWMCGATRKYNNSGAGFQKDHREKIELVRHVMRSDGEHILRKVLRADIPGKRKRGRPKTRWKVACQRDLKSTGLRAGEETDRAMWRRKLISHTGDPT